LLSFLGIEFGCRGKISVFGKLFKLMPNRLQRIKRSVVSIRVRRWTSYAAKCERIQTSSPREGAAALPYAEFLASASPINKRQDQTWQRVARWNVEREGREPKVIHSSSVVEVNTGDFGTNAMHLPRKRYPLLQRQYVREDTAALPYAENLFRKAVTNQCKASASSGVRCPSEAGIHQRPVTTSNCECEVLMGVLVEAGDGHHTQLNVNAYKHRSHGRTRRSSPTRRIWHPHRRSTNGTMHQCHPTIPLLCGTIDHLSCG